MSVRKFEANGRVYHLGRMHSPPRRKLHLSDYATATLPPPPATVDYSAQAGTAVMQDIFLNDNEGDCVIADHARFIGIVAGMGGGSPFVYTNAQVNADYSAIGGYVPGDPSTDQGCDPETALAYYQSHGYADGSKLACWYAIDATNELLVKQAIWLGGSIAVALNLPDAWVNNIPTGDGFTWDVAGGPDPNNGHEVNALGYTAQGMIIDTWGMKGIMTWAATAMYCTVKAGGNLYGRMDADMVNKATQLAPNGFAWSALLSDAQAMGGNPVIPPGPTPVPTPPAPAPTPVPTPPSPTPAPPSLITIDAVNHVIAVPTPATWVLIPNGQSSLPTPARATINWLNVLWAIVQAAAPVVIPILFPPAPVPAPVPAPSPTPAPTPAAP